MHYIQIFNLGFLKTEVSARFASNLFIYEAFCAKIVSVATQETCMGNRKYKQTICILKDPCCEVVRKMGFLLKKVRYVISP